MNYSVIIPTLWRCNLENFYKTLKIFGDNNQIKYISQIMKKEWDGVVF